MARQTYVFRDGQLVPKETAGPNIRPHVMTDTMDETWHPADGKHYTSKSKFRRVTRAHGCEEVGNEKQYDRREFDRVTKRDVHEAIEMVRQGYRPNLRTEPDID